VPPLASDSDSRNDSVFTLPWLLKSLQVFPVFQTQRPIACPVGQLNEDGTCQYLALRPPPVFHEYIAGLLGKKPSLRSLWARSNSVQFAVLKSTPHAICIHAWPPCSAVTFTRTSKSVPGVSSGTGVPVSSYHFCHTLRPWSEAAELPPHAVALAHDCGSYLNSEGKPLGALFLTLTAISFLLTGIVTQAWPAAREAKSAKATATCLIPPS